MSYIPLEVLIYLTNISLHLQWIKAFIKRMDDNGTNSTSASLEESDFDHQQEIVFLVVMEMTIGVVGIFLNLMIVSSVRSEDSLQESTRNLLLANICFSNLVVSFLVKPISAIYVSYALSTGEWSVGLAFCSLYTLSYRTTWLVYPFTILALCWHAVTSLFVCCRPQHQNGTSTSTINTKHGSTVRLEIQDSIEEDIEWAKVKRARAFPTIKQKSILFCIWMFSTLYGLAACFPEKLFGQSREPTTATLPSSLNLFKSDMSFCPMRATPGDVLDSVTIYLSIYIPTILGPLLTLILCVVSLPFAQCRQNSSSCWSTILLPCLIFLHISNYYISLFLADSQDNDFHFLLVKYGMGFSFIILSPLLIIATQDDIRFGVKKTFKSSVLCSVSAPDKHDGSSQTI